MRIDPFDEEGEGGLIDGFEGVCLGRSFEEGPVEGSVEGRRIIAYDLLVDLDLSLHRADDKSNEIADITALKVRI